MAPLLASLLFLLSFLSFSQDITPNAEVVLGREVPNVILTDSKGKRLSLRELSEGKPVLLSFIYTRCTSSCPLIVQRLREALSRIDSEDYKVVLVDFDDRDTISELGKFVKQRQIYEPGWSVVLVESKQLMSLTRTLDFKFFYDKETDMFAHPNVLIVLSPKLKVTGYILGISYDPQRLSALLKEAREERVSINPIKGLLLKCFRFDPVTGTYSIDWSFVAMVLGGLIPITVMFYYVVLKNILLGFRRATG
ncbi:protein SCO1/2 [Hydrogenivirga caldilitoris]|uniref:Protein SCO1/2 n=1 Tax=Hydrogenivirga caldilitoris TaxID=246264 RepID=A0A497XPF3_9AQUI|nr:SCO family protein [Hydrogenivirga caldilitoris]RLJ70837.1 protein SCO1/2 [Hydrogenivirga caldilitoris]